MERLSALLDDVAQLETRLRRTEAPLDAAQEQLERGEDTLAQLKVELELRDSLLEVLQAKSDRPLSGTDPWLKRPLRPPCLLPNDRLGEIELACRDRMGRGLVKVCGERRGPLARMKRWASDINLHNPKRRSAERVMRDVG